VPTVFRRAFCSKGINLKKVLELGLGVILPSRTSVLLMVSWGEPIVFIKNERRDDIVVLFPWKINAIAVSIIKGVL